ncbi:MAG: pyridoxal-phosphate dependent enzyme [Thermoplasmata archaeon]
MYIYELYILKIMKAVCSKCGKERTGLEIRCRHCGAVFEYRPDFKYRDRIEDNYPYLKNWVSLGEVTTPILSIANIMLKLDYYSPTYSYKDRGARAMISALAEWREKYNVQEINEDSSGNAGAAISAYGVRAGFKVNIFVPEHTVPAKIGQIMSYGANIFKVPGNRDAVQNAAETHKGVYASHVFMPEFRDGLRTLAYEIFKQVKMPDRVFVPVSAGTLLTGMYSGFRHLYESGEITKIPELVAVQTEAVSPLCALINHTIYDPNRKIESIADALVSTKPTLIDMMADIIKNHGLCVTVTEKEIKDARTALALKGIYAEYSSATVYAAYKKRNFDGQNLLVITGNGLKNSAY